MGLQVLPATHALIGGVGQNNGQQLPSYANLQAADPNNQRAPADIQGSYPRLQTNPTRDLQPQGYYNQQMPQVGVDYHSLSFLASPLARLVANYGASQGTAYPAFNDNGYHYPAYGGSGWLPGRLALPLPMPNFQLLQHLPQVK